MLLIALAALDFGRAYVAGVALTQAAREGARLAASSTGSSFPSETQAKQRVVDSVGSTMPVESTSSAGVALSTSDVTIAVRDTNGTTQAFTSRTGGSAVEVTVTGYVPLLAAFMAEGVDGLAPGVGLCQGSGPSKRCGITTMGRAHMMVL
jgi:hypothetical protein